MIRLVALFWLAMASAALALDPSETLDDPALEARAQALDAELRCVVCQSEALTSSNADWARDARAVLREMIVDGKSDQEIKDFFVARYGEFVLMDPPKTGSTLVLWAAGPVMLILALLVAVSYVRRGGSRVRTGEAPLSAEEEKRLRDILDE